jgi:hypothetical protein
MVRRSIMAGRFRETALMAKKPGGKRSTKNVLCLPDLDHSKTSVLQSLIVGLATLFSIPVSVIAVAAGVALRESKIAQKNRLIDLVCLPQQFCIRADGSRADTSAPHPPPMKNLRLPKNGIPVTCPACAPPAGELTGNETSQALVRENRADFRNTGHW